MTYLLVCDKKPEGIYHKGIEAKEIGYSKLRDNTINEFSVYNLTEVCHANHAGREERELLWEEGGDE